MWVDNSTVCTDTFVLKVWEKHCYGVTAFFKANKIGKEGAYKVLGLASMVMRVGRRSRLCTKIP